MFKAFIMSAVLFIFAAAVYSDSDDSYWNNRNSVEGAKKAYEYYKEMYSKETNYENAWKFARSAHYLADNYIQKAEQKKPIFLEAKKAAENATNLGPGKVEGHYYLGISVGSWAEANGILDSLFTADLIIKEATKTINIDPSYENGSGYMLRARVYHLAPAIISVGDTKKAQSDYEKAIEYGPGNRVAFRFYAELLMDLDRKKAAEIITQGLNIPLDEGNIYEDQGEINQLKNLQKKL